MTRGENGTVRVFEHNFHQGCMSPKASLSMFAVLMIWFLVVVLCWYQISGEED